MSKLTIRDTVIVLGLSIASQIFLMVPLLYDYPLSLIPEFLILAVLPGYALIAFIKSSFNQAPFYKRTIYSIVTSILLTVLTYFILSYTFVNISIYTVLICLTLFLGILTIIKRFFIDRKLHSQTKEKKSKVYPEEKSTTKKLVNDDFNALYSSKDEIKTNLSIKKGYAKKTPHESLESEKKGLLFFNLDIILILILTVLGVIFVLEPTLNKTTIRTVLGLLFVLLIPGYALITFLFPRKDDLEIIERLALSFGLSIAITPLIGLALNYTPFGIRLDPILISLSSITTVLCSVTFLRRQKIPKDILFYVDFFSLFKGLVKGFKRDSKSEKILSVVLICSILLAVSATTYIITKPKNSESFTEFYILGPDGTVSNYPTNLTSGEDGKVIVGIVNHENIKTSYHLIITSNGTLKDDQILTLNTGEKLEIPFTFTADNPGESKIEFILYKIPNNNTIYRSLHLWVNITD